MTTILHKIKDPGSAITHFIGMLAALLCAAPLLAKAPDAIHIVSLAIFISSMILLYGASATYHTFDISKKANTLLKRIDHMMIFILIAGSYTPVCLIVLNGKTGYLLLSIIWSIALIGIIIKCCFIFCPKWVSSILYIAMGWTIVFAFAPLLKALPQQAFLLLLAGGLIYTAGGVIYAIKLPFLNEDHPYLNSHVIFHIFVLGGSLCHFLFMYHYVAQMPM